MRTILMAIGSALVMAGASAAPPQPVTIGDDLQMKAVGAPAGSPDGRQKTTSR